MSTDVMLTGVVFVMVLLCCYSGSPRHVEMDKKALLDEVVDRASKAKRRWYALDVEQMTEAVLVLCLRIASSVVGSGFVLEVVDDTHVARFAVAVFFFQVRTYPYYMAMLVDCSFGVGLAAAAVGLVSSAALAICMMMQPVFGPWDAAMLAVAICWLLVHACYFIRLNDYYDVAAEMEREKQAKAKEKKTK